jgi:signal transduction histidine kinase
LVHVVVGDSGPGLAAGTERRLFEAFYTTKAGGMGMGLSIARSIVESHGGKIWAANGADGGAEFHFTIPRLGVPASARRVEAGADAG